MGASGSAEFITINGRRIGPGAPVYIIAEMSANHHGDFNQAVEIIRAAKESGADAIKLQTYTPDTMTIRSNRPEFQIGAGTIWEGRGLYELYEEAMTPWEWHVQLRKVAREEGLDFFSAAFDATAVDFLEELEVPVHKIASFENGDLPLIQKAAATGKPLIISTGMASLSEIDQAVRTARLAGADGVALLKCTSAYPAPPEEMNLKTIPHLAGAFGLPVGLSDHSMGPAVPVAAVALGAAIIEKHLTLSRAIAGPDSSFSMEPAEFAAMVKAVRVAEQALGRISYEVGAKEAAGRVFRRSLFVVAGMKADEIFTRNNVRSIRPGHGMEPVLLDTVLGRRATADIEPGTPLTWTLVGGEG
ncbi:MAG: pseudaminic acid synthase [Proteobacteria bacterium]|nr:pseudaminic acid synthase [Pseudomonadota bacterium]MBU1687943.1 pseudaminic acid synthase [Pseudomonadota bacterium]